MLPGHLLGGGSPHQALGRAFSPQLACLTSSQEAGPHLGQRPATSQPRSPLLPLVLA